VKGSSVAQPFLPPKEPAKLGVLCGAFGVFEDKKRKWQWKRTRYVCFWGPRSRLEASFETPTTHGPIRSSQTELLRCCQDASLPSLLVTVRNKLQNALRPPAFLAIVLFEVCL